MKSEKVRKFFGLCPKNNDIRLRRVKVLRSESFVFLVSLKEEREEKTGFACCLFVQIITRLFPDMCREKTPREPRTRRRKRGSRGENRISVSEFCCLPVLICLPVLLLCLPVCHTVPTTLTVAVPGTTFHVPSAFCVYVAAGTTICPATVANAPVALS